MKVKESTIEKKENLEVKEKKEQGNALPKRVEKTKSDVLAIFSILVLIFITIILIITVAFTYINTKNTKIYNGIYIKGINISNLNKEEAITKIKDYINSNIPEEIRFKSENYECAISSEELNINFNVEEAVDVAYNIGRNGNVFVNNWNIIQANISNINIDLTLSIDQKRLKSNLEEMSANLPDKVIESSYYIEENKLFVTKGKTGNVVDEEKMAENIKNKIYNLDLKNNLEIIKISKEPSSINIDEIYSQIHKEAKDAYYTQNPFTVYPSENGVDFEVSIDEVKKMLEEDKEEYIIPLKILYPKVTTNMIGTEAFPDLLSTFSTKYAASNKNRTTNLILASNKINGTVLMPGEVFSYNKVVGKRTIAAGYKEAPIYVSGRVEDGLGGGICQITSTLYNAVVFANLEIVERSNHQFVPSYVGASRDATVVYGALDFKFKNNRQYPIKIMCSVSGGIANFKIYGLKTDNEYEVEISTKITSSTANSLNSQAYKILKKNGQVVSSELLSKDTYKKH